MMISQCRWHFTHIKILQCVALFRNLGAMSHVKVSFDMPEYTADCDGVGVLRMLDAIRACGLEKSTRFYQASTSELYGKVQEVPQSETTPFFVIPPWRRRYLAGMLNWALRVLRRI
mmetsp:Transcript_16085/g.27409  ORF Transcript_16085/g.27409 Transcript_16085/m.27409 type:complete len:116 (+) Transcript_16085:494-841(+)